ncbi:MAG: ribosome silencing factor [Campylobacterales bacterium]|nr:ribosome silencing factor [Campylobacterales bacterium]NQY52404.1 ribosome silencing factor [Campylobacteraceae bacterium]
MSRCDEIRRVLDEKKAENIEIIDLKSKNYIVDYVVIATVLNGKHAYSLLNYLKTEVKGENEQFLRVDEDSDWTVIDLGDVLIHLMSESHRKKYSIGDFLSTLDNK